MLKEKDSVDRALVQRVERGWILANLGKVLKDGPLYLVESSTGRGSYYVDLKRDTCECEDWQRRRDTCKHLVAATMYSIKG